MWPVTEYNDSHIVNRIYSCQCTCPSCMAVCQRACQHTERWRHRGSSIDAPARPNVTSSDEPEGRQAELEVYMFAALREGKICSIHEVTRTTGGDPSDRALAHATQ